MPSRWTARESELLAVTLRLLQQHGYDRLSLDEVAAESRASKATMYRRWPSKAELVLAAFIEGTRTDMELPNTGSLREDLLAVGAQMLTDVELHAPTMRAILNEVARSPALVDAFRSEFIAQLRLLMMELFGRAVARGEIDAAVVNEEIWDVFSGYLVFRTLLPVRPPTMDTVRALIDEVMLPSLMRDIRR